jgi:hypothetical protein
MLWRVTVLSYCVPTSHGRTVLVTLLTAALWSANLVLKRREKLLNNAANLTVKLKEKNIIKRREKLGKNTPNLSLKRREKLIIFPKKYIFSANLALKLINNTVTNPARNVGVSQ